MACSVWLVLWVCTLIIVRFLSFQRAYRVLFHASMQGVKNMWLEDVEIEDENLQEDESAKPRVYEREHGVEEVGTDGRQRRAKEEAKGSSSSATDILPRKLVGVLKTSKHSPGTRRNIIKRVQVRLSMYQSSFAWRLREAGLIVILPICIFARPLEQMICHLRVDSASKHAVQRQILQTGAKGLSIKVEPQQVQSRDRHFESWAHKAGKHGPRRWRPLTFLVLSALVGFWYRQCWHR